MSENLKEKEVSLTQSNNLSFEEQFQNSTKNNNHISNKKIVIPFNSDKDLERILEILSIEVDVD